MYQIPALLIALLLLIGVIGFYLLGGIVSRRRAARGVPVSAGIGPMEGALLGLLSLLLAFTFNRAASHYDEHRSLMVQEVNAMGTVIARSALFEASEQAAFQRDMRAYVQARLEYYDARNDQARVTKAIADAEAIFSRIWERTAQFSRTDAGVVRYNMMLPALNQMIDLVSQREEERKVHLPDPILALLFVLCLIGSFVIGYSHRTERPDWVVILIYSAMSVTTIYFIIDLDRPRRGVINTSHLRDSMEKLFDRSATNTGAPYNAQR